MTQQIEVSIGKRPYKMAVDGGEETRVRALAEYFNSFVEKMQTAMGATMERDRVLVLAALMMADEHFNTRQARETEGEVLDKFLNNVAQRLENLVEEKGKA